MNIYIYIYAYVYFRFISYLINYLCCFHCDVIVISSLHFAGPTSVAVFAG